MSLSGNKNGQGGGNNISDYLQIRKDKHVVKIQICILTKVSSFKFV